MYPPQPQPYNPPNPNPITKQSTCTSKTAARKPCASCKLQRHRCPPDCILAPYFPANQPDRFSRAHRLFGRCKIARCLSSLADPDDREDAAKAIIYEADARFANPVGGAHAVQRDLMLHVQSAFADLRFVRRLIQHVKDCNNVAAPPAIAAARSDPQVKRCGFTHSR